MKNTCLHILIITLLLLSSCSGSKDKVTTSAASENDTIIVTSETSDSLQPLLIYYQTRDSFIDCYKKVLPNGATDLIARFTKKPLDAVWDNETGIVYFITEKGVFKKSFRDRYSPFITFASSLPKYAAGYFGSAWFDSKSGNLCVSYGLTENEFSKAQRYKFDKLAKDSTTYLPDWGMNMFAVISELDENGKWSNRHEEITMGEACDTPGLEVLCDNISMKKNTVSMISESELATFYGKILWGLKEGENELDSVKLKKYRNTFELTEEDRIFVLPINKQKSLYTIVSYIGSKPGYRLPIYLCDKQKGKPQQLIKVKTIPADSSNLNLYYEEMGISLKNDFILIANIHEEKTPYLFDRKSLKQIGSFSKSTNAFILEFKN